MRPAVRLRLTAAVALGVVLAGCGTVGSDADSGPHTARIVVLVPAEGKQADAGAAVLAAVRLALSDAGLTIPDWTVEVAGVDGGADAGTAAEVAAELASDEDVAAVVGGLSAQVVRSVQPVLAGASVLFVSPADVAREHTRGADPASPLRPYADRFRADAGRLGAEVVAFGAAGREGTGIEAVIAAAVSDKADVVYVAGDATVAALVAKKLAGTGLPAHLVGGVNLRSEDFMAAAGTAADGAVAVVGPSLRRAPGQAVDDLTARLAQQGIDAPGPFAAAAHDAGTALVQALVGCLPLEDSAAQVRTACVGEMDQVSFAGITGEVTFDRYGDRTGALPAVYEVRDGAWTEVGAA